MITAVVPARNEAERIPKVLANLAELPLDAVITVINGCQDRTLQVVRETRIPSLKVLLFREPLGIDVPRAIGAKYSQELGADAVLFVDGDMIGTPPERLAELLSAVRDGCDVALTNCYPGATHRYAFANTVLEARHRLNEELGLFPRLGLASPAHGPHAVSRRFLTTVPLRELAVPPVALVLAAQASLNIDIGTTIPHLRLSSSVRDARHAKMVGDTLVGDSLEALCVLKGEQRWRRWEDRQYLGYHPFRRWDILEAVLSGQWPAGAKSAGTTGGN
ncbi:hypothetical protein SY88_19360 [Clostridiales bacterium PH28_bin88]|nr:hypothetical protein SY88_19360 [Clostridiales bacterium PH28_bin88]